METELKQGMSEGASKRRVWRGQCSNISPFSVFTQQPLVLSLHWLSGRDAEGSQLQLLLPHQVFCDIAAVKKAEIRHSAPPAFFSMCRKPVHLLDDNTQCKEVTAAEMGMATLLMCSQVLNHLGHLMRYHLYLSNRFYRRNISSMF